MPGSNPASLPNVLMHADMLPGRIKMMNLSELKDILLDPTVEEQVDPVAPPVSFLLTWTNHTQDDIGRMLRSGTTVCGTPYPGENWFRSAVTEHDGRDVRKPLSWPVTFFNPDTGPSDMFKVAQQEIVYSLLEMYYDLTRNTSNKWVRIPAEVRVRDIVHYRLFKKEFQKIDPEGKTGMKVRCDNVLGFNRPEKINQPLHAFCGSCLELGQDHQRCARCQIAHYCSTECQKKDWPRHKLECKECQAQQEEWNEKLIEFGYERL